jgi:Flp pilus assembly protein TadG
MRSYTSKTNGFAPRDSLRRRALGYMGGQMAVVFALAAVTLCGVMALGADVGVLYYNWVQLQKAADAAALAGAQILGQDPSDPTPATATLATTTAQTYATNNGVSANDLVTATPQSGNTQMSVSIKRTVPYSFARVLGLTTGYVNVMAVAQIPNAVSTVNCGPNCPVSCGGVPCTSGAVSVPAGSGTPGSGAPFAGSCGSGTGQFNVLPIALDNKTLWSSGSITTLNQQDVNGNGNGNNNSWPDAPGNWGYVNLCGNSNSSGSVLRAGMAAGYGGELTIGNTLTTVPGAKNGPVDQGISDRAPTTLSAAPATYVVSNNARVVVIPIVDFSKDASTGGTCSGTCTVKITGFMAVYILSVNGGDLTVQDIGIVDPNSVSATAGTINTGAMGDIVLKQ